MNGQCEQIEPLIVDYALGELDSSKAELVEQHARSCPRCSDALKEVRQMVAGLSQCEMAEPPAAATAAVREAVRDKAFGRRKAGAVVADLAGSFARRPLLAGASAVVAIAAMTFLLLLPNLPGPKERGDDKPGKRWGGTVLKPLGDYLVESREFLELASRADAGKALSTYVQDDWKQLIGQSKYLQEDDDLKEYMSLLTDLEGFYQKVLLCGGRFGEKELGEVRQLLDKAMLTERVDEAIKSWR